MPTTPRHSHLLLLAVVLLSTAAGAAEPPPEPSTCPSLVQTAKKAEQSQSGQEQEMAKKLEAQDLRLQAAEQRIMQQDARIAQLEDLLRSLLPPQAGEASEEILQAGSDQEAAVTGNWTNSTSMSQAVATVGSGRDTRALLSRRSQTGAIWDEVKKLWDKVKSFGKDLGDVVKQIKPATIWQTIKKEMVKWKFVKAIASGINKIKKFAMKGIDFFTGLYDKYLKPIINHIGGCLSSGNPINFVFCLLQPAINKLMQLLLPAGDVAVEVPFPNEKVAKVYDFTLGKYLQTTECLDCNGDDPRDQAPVKCRDFDKEMGLGTFKYSVCDAPFGMDKSKKISEEIKANLWACQKKAAIFRDGPWADISGNVTAGRVSMFAAEDVAGRVLTNIRSFQASGWQGNMGNDNAKAYGVQIKQSIESAFNNCQSAVDTSTQLMTLFTQVLEKPHKVPGKLTGMIEKATACADELAAVSNVLDVATQTALVLAVNKATVNPEIKAAQAGITEMLSGVQAAIDAVSGDLQDDLEDRMRLVAAPDWKSLADLPKDCAIGKGPYMKLYAGFEGNNPITGMGELFRMSLHQRAGFKFAWKDFDGFNKGMVIKSIEYTWEELLAATNDKRNSYTVKANEVCYGGSWSKAFDDRPYTAEECKAICNSYPPGTGANNCEFFWVKIGRLARTDAGKCVIRSGPMDEDTCVNNNYWYVYKRDYADTSPGVETEFCYIFFCVRVNFFLTKHLKDVMGIPLPNSLQLTIDEEVYFFSFGITYFDVTLKKLSIPVTLSLPIDPIFPSMTVPFLVSIPSPALLSNVPAAKVTETFLSAEATASLDVMKDEEEISVKEARGQNTITSILGPEDSELSDVAAAEGDLDADITDADINGD